MTSTTPAQDTTQAAPSTTSPSPAAAPQQPKSTSSKPKQRRKPVKRRGAKVEEEDEEHSGNVAHDKATAAANEDASDSDSDFDAGGAPDDEEEEEDDDDESEAEGAADPKTPGQGSTEQLPPPASPGDTKALLADGSALHPSWSEMPAVGESGAEDLPTLDFASLTPGALAAVAKPAAPSRQASATGAGAAERSDKKAQLLAKREAKSAELKAKDPVAWEAQEQERKERDVLRKKEKNLRSKEKKRERKLAEQQQQGTSTPAAAASTQDNPASAPSTSALPPRAAQKPTRPAVPSRPSRTAVQLGLANADASTSSSAAAQRPPPPHARAPPTGPASTRPPPHFNQGPSPDYIQAREAYSTRLANDPSYTPRVGKFWSHDDRLASPEVRPLVWRGRGGRGGERGGFVGRGRGRGRGGVRGAEGGHAVGGWVQEDGADQEKTPEKKVEEGAGEEKPEDKAEKSEGDDPDDDGWGRGEVKKQRNSSTPSAFASAPAWRHDGFEELQEAEARPASANGRGRGGFRGGRGGRGGWVGSTSHDANGRPIPGAVNPRYANLPFHPQHRFPLAPPTPAPVVDAPNPEDQTTSRSVAGEASLFDESAGEQSKPAVGVRLPGSVAAAPSPVELAIKGTAALSLEEAVPEQVTAAVQTVEAASVERPAESTGILYSANPNRLPSDEQAPPPPLPAQLAYPPALQQQFHQLPPHLQPQGPPPPFPSQAAPQGQFIPRHASPAYYPTMHHQQQAYYSPDAFPSMPTPGATPPPPPLYPLGPPGAGGQAFFAPPRTSKIEIKAPGSSTILSASGDAFSPRPAPPFVPHHQQQQPQYSPISSRDGMTGTPGSPQTMHRQQQQHQQQMQMYGGGGYPSPYEYEQQQQHAHAVENGGIVYFVKPNPNGPPSHQQQQQARYQQQQPTHNPYYDPYAQHHQQQQQHGGGPGAYGAGGQHQQDPAILMSSGGGYESQQQHGGYGNPGEAAVYQHWG